MKAASAVLVQSQKQMSLLGLPPMLTIIAAGIAVTAAAVAAVIGLTALFLPIAGVVFVGLWLTAFRLGRTNPFLDRDLFVATRFWASGRAVRRGRRHLVAGGTAA